MEKDNSGNVPKVTKDTRVITTKSTWEEAQKSKLSPPNKLEIEIPDTLFLSMEGEDYLIYVNIDGEHRKLTNIKEDK